MLLLTLNTFGITGGIEKVSRILAKAIHDQPPKSKNLNQKLDVMSLCDSSSDVDLRYCRKKDFKGFSGNKLLFGIMATIHSFKKNTIILSHVNLLLIALIIRLVSPNKRIILLAHGIEVWRDLNRWKIAFLKKNVEIWAVSNFTAEVLNNKHKISKDQIVVLNNCLDPFFNLPAEFIKPNYLLERHQILNGQNIILTISRLSSFESYKGYDYVISALRGLLKTYPNLLYLLAGKSDNVEKARIEKLIKAEHLENHVVLLDFIPDHELTDYFLLADAFIMPSKKEGFGLVFIEAAACGCSIIGGNIDGSSDALLNGELGKLINPENVQEIESSLLTSLAEDKDPLRAKIIQSKCLDHFGYEAYKHKISTLLSA
ncbi:glycosyltransferase family 4 protein [Pedobacter mucosus]|uniref:glycosyltransferase family 4 protein n=1 Tax=Pedobacter mucosus TaxID=2895286 RepID=UPI001EE49917|nr:glycosyltransferase family 4 protein [Pedobacter mucosus]UKT64405.1 glycosyltransferase family 4 protein [Pedobacter mucosus]